MPHYHYFAQVVARYKDFQPQNISNTLWAFATLAEQPSEAFLKAVEQHVLNFTDDYSSQASPPSPQAKQKSFLCNLGDTSRSF